MLLTNSAGHLRRWSASVLNAYSSPLSHWPRQSTMSCVFFSPHSNYQPNVKWHWLCKSVSCFSPIPASENQLQLLCWSWDMGPTWERKWEGRCFPIILCNLFPVSHFCTIPVYNIKNMLWCLCVVYYKSHWWDLERTGSKNQVFVYRTWITL